MSSIIYLLLVFLVTFVPNQGIAGPSEITIGFIPGEGQKAVKDNALILAEKLKKILRVPVNVLVSKDYAGLSEAMKSGKIQYGFFSAATFVAAEKESGAKVLMKKVWDHPFYYSALLTLGKSKIRTVEDMKGKRIAFVDRRSASGYLYPAVMFKQRSIDIEKYFSKIVYSGDHARSVELLEKGEVDIIAVFADEAKGQNSAWQKYKSGGNISKIHVNWISEAIPTDPFCVHQSFYDKYPRFTHDLMYALIELGESEGGENFIKKTIGATSLQLATSRQYDPVREMVRLLKLELD
jgi:phosphonate transport system substrate-binding protein